MLGWSWRFDWDFDGDDGADDRGVQTTKEELERTI